MNQLTDSLVDNAVVDLGPTTPFSFPSTPAGELASLADAHSVQQSTAERESSWLTADGHLLDPTRRSDLGMPLFEAVNGVGFMDRATSGFLSGAIVDLGRERSAQSGRVVPFDPAEHSMSQMIELSTTGGGLALPHLERRNRGLASLHFDLTAASHAETTIVLVAGSVDLGEALGPMSQCGVWSLAGEVVVRGPATSPLPLDVDEIIWIDEPAQIVGDAQTLAMVVCMRSPDSADEQKFLLRRMTCHPIMRLDTAIRVDDRQHVYGIGDDAPWIDLIDAEVRSVLENATVETFEAWWSTRLTCPTRPLLQIRDDSLVRGRFPGGVGVLSSDDRGHVLVAGRRVFAIRPGLLGMLHQLLDGSTVAVSRQSPSVDLVALLAQYRLLESVPVATNGSDDVAE